MSIYPLEMVEWYDAESDVSWSEKDDVIKWSNKPFVVTEVGFVFYEDKNFLVIISQIGNDGTLGNRTRIPKPWIKSRKKICYGRPKGRAKRAPNDSDSS